MLLDGYCARSSMDGQGRLAAELIGRRKEYEFTGLAADDEGFKAAGVE